MKEEAKIREKILEIAQRDTRIRAVLLNGSRANPKVSSDRFQDFDVVFIVDDFQSFLVDRSWLGPLGKPVLQQLPDEMQLGRKEGNERQSFAFLMIFEDGSRIDLTLFALSEFKKEKTDSLTEVWLDKDALFAGLPESSDADYLVIKPAQQEFSEVANEFWWTATYVAKGLKRGEVLYAKEMLETVVRPMFLQMIFWKVGYENSFSISVGKSGKFLEKFLAPEFYQNLLNTYADADIERNWQALFLMTAIFKSVQVDLASKLGFHHDEQEQNAAEMHIRRLYRL